MSYMSTKLGSNVEVGVVCAVFYLFKSVSRIFHPSLKHLFPIHDYDLHKMNLSMQNFSISA